MKKLNIVPGFFIGIMILGCERNEIFPAKMYLTELTDPTCYTDQFEYEDGRLILFTRKFSQKVSTTTNFKYENGQLVEIRSILENGQTYLVDLEYNADGKRKKEKITLTQEGQRPIITLSDFTYDGAGNLKAKTSIYSDSTYSFSTESHFAWRDGNLVTMTVAHPDYPDDGISSITSFTYDNKRNYTNQDLAFAYVDLMGVETALSRNNPITVRERVADVETEKISYRFHYNANGYPAGYTFHIAGHDYDPVQMKYR